MPRYTDISVVTSSMKSCLSEGEMWKLAASLSERVLQTNGWLAPLFIRLEVTPGVPKQIMLRMGNLQCFNNRVYAVSRAYDFAVLHNPMQLVFLGDSLRKRA